MTLWWQLLSMFVVFGALAAVAYCVYDAHRESKELAELSAKTAIKRSHRYIV